GDPNRSFASGDLLLYKGNIVAKNRDGIMVMLDATNGKKVWSLSETGSNLGGRLRIFKDYAYFTSSNNLMVVNLSLGELLINERPPSGNWAEGTVAIDETNNLLFYNDRVSGFCAKIPE
ncbi:MAG TPA: hypothetical protein DCG19_07360, partial [Cryomorphaceae bacterium]|nr:hypothetical protein [Cryomorphaceae bacterium]